MAWIGCGRDLSGRGMSAVAWAGLVWSAAAAAAPPAIDSLPLTAAYGDGVHAYFAGDYDRAYEDLSQAIEAGTNDPRVFYFRGLAALRLGRGDEAEADFTTGADRESAGLGTWPVSRSLERIQGPDRLRLERHRTRARLANLQRERQADAERYSGIEAAQPDVRRMRRPVRAGAGAAEEVNPFQAEQPERAPPEPVRPVDPADAPAERIPEPPMPGRTELPAPRAVVEDPFDDSASKAQQRERLAAEREDAAAQADQQAEQDAAAGR